MPVHVVAKLDSVNFGCQQLWQEAKEAEEVRRKRRLAAKEADEARRLAAMAPPPAEEPTAPTPASPQGFTPV